MLLRLRANGVNWTPVFGPVVAIAKVDRTGSGAAVADFPRSAVVRCFPSGRQPASIRRQYKDPESVQ